MAAVSARARTANPIAVAINPGTITGTRPIRSEVRPASGRVRIAPPPLNRKKRETSPRSREPPSSASSGRNAIAALKPSVTLRNTSIGKTAGAGTSARKLIGGADPSRRLGGSRWANVSRIDAPAVNTPTIKTASKPPATAISPPSTGAAVWGTLVAIPKKPRPSPRRRCGTISATSDPRRGWVGRHRDPVRAAQEEQRPDVGGEDHRRERQPERQRPNPHLQEPPPAVAPAPDERAQQDRQEVVAAHDQADFKDGRAQIVQFRRQRRGEIEEAGEVEEGAEQR